MANYPSSAIRAAFLRVRTLRPDAHPAEILALVAQSLADDEPQPPLFPNPTTKVPE